MKYTLFFIFSCFLFVNTIFAQKVDLDTKKINYSYYQLPETPFPENMRTYTVNVPILEANSVGRYTKPDHLKKTMNIEGFTRLNQGGAVNIEVKLLEYYELNNNVVSNPQTQLHYARIRYEFVGTITATRTDNGQVLIRKITDKFPHYYSSPAVADYQIASANSKSASSDIFNKELADFFKIFSDEFNSKYGYVMKNEVAELQFLDSPKHPEYESFKLHFNKASAIINQISVATADMSQLITEAKPVIAYFESLGTKYIKDEKGDKKMRHGGYSNAAILSYCIDDLEQAAAFSQKVISCGYETKDGQKLLDITVLEKQRMLANKTKQRHFILSWQKTNEMPEESSAIGLSNHPEVKFPLVMVSFIATSIDDKQYDMQVKTNKLFLLCHKKGIKDATRKDGSEVTIMTENFKSFEFPADCPVLELAGKKFVNIKLSESTLGIVDPKSVVKEFMEVVSDGKIKIYKSYKDHPPGMYDKFSVSDLVNRFNDQKSKIKLEESLNIANHNADYFLQKGKEKPKPVESSNMENLFDDNSEFLKAFKKEVKDTNMKLGDVSTGWTNFDLKQMGTLIKSRIEAVLRYNNATK